jgi:predicted DNA-binding transcriptional regulator YafY
VRRFHLDTSDWYRAAVPPEHLQTVADAVWNGRRLAMRYASWERVSDSTVEPLGLVLKAGIWYMAARPVGRTQVRSYRLDAVEALQPLEARFEPPRFDLAAWWHENTARFEAGLYTGRARVRVTEAGYQRLRAFGAAVAQAAADSVEPSAVEGCVEVEVPIESVRHAAREMLRLGADGEVLAPAELRQALHEAAQAMLARYGDAL